MNLHEYQAKELLKKYNVPVQEGVAVETVDAAAAAYATLKEQTGNNFAVIKAQIHAGGRGKGSIEGKEQRGVAVAKNEEDVKRIAGNLLGGTLVTIQTTKGKETGKYGRILGTIMANEETSVNQMLIENGHAVEYFGGKR